MHDIRYSNHVDSKAVSRALLIAYWSVSAVLALPVLAWIMVATTLAPHRK